MEEIEVQQYAGYIINTGKEVVSVPEMRGRLGITQKELSLLFMVSVETIQGWESGRKKPSSSSKILLGMLVIDSQKTIRLLNRLGKLN